MVSRRNYAAITIVMAIVFFLFQFLNMAKDHWNNYSTNQYAKNVEELPGADSVYLASTSDNLDQQDDNFIKWSHRIRVLYVLVPTRKEQWERCLEIGPYI